MSDTGISPGWDYNQWARIYREFEADFVDLPRRFFFEIARRQAAGPVERLLEIGCGDGKGLDCLCKLFPGAEAVGIDPDTRAARVARLRLKGRARVLPGAVEDLETLGAFDLVVSYMNLRLWADVPAGLRAIQRALTPNGMAYVVDLRRDIPETLKGQSLAALPQDRFREVSRAQLQAALSLQDLRDHLTAAGIEAYRLLEDLPAGRCRGAAGQGEGEALARLRRRMSRAGQPASFGRLQMHLFLYPEG